LSAEPAELPLIFATVGTDVHPFHRMPRWIDAWLAEGGSERARVFLQTGTSDVPELAEHRPYLGYAEMESRMREAAVVVCHGGPGTIMLAVSLGKRPIVVPRDAGRGEHVDNHQVAFSRRIAADGAALLAESEEDFRRHLEAALAGEVEPLRRTAGSDPAIAAARFEELVQGLFVPRGRRSAGDALMGGRGA
jgi:UDP-N-acetylglucosamine transferase subunit ALG13